MVFDMQKTVSDMLVTKVNAISVKASSFSVSF